MIEAVMLWNEPNNKSHWDLEIDPDWARFASMTRLAGDAIASEAPGLPRVLGGISPIDPLFIANLAGRGCSTGSTLLRSTGSRSIGICG
jgi:beta-xylosidase